MRFGDASGPVPSCVDQPGSNLLAAALVWAGTPPTGEIVVFNRRL